MGADQCWQDRMTTLHGIVDGLEPDELVAIRWMADRRATVVFAQPARVINTSKLTGRLLEFAEEMNRDGILQFLSRRVGYQAFAPLAEAACDEKFQKSLGTIVARAHLIPPRNQE